MATKRSNPFIEDFMPQSKVHVGLKQFNNNEDRLRKVYEKTLELLFKGARKFPSHDDNNQDADVVNKRDGMKQLIIGRDGSLCNDEVKVQHKLKPVADCSCGATLEVKCNYCERSLCTLCQCLCSRCEKYYCSQCLLIRVIFVYYYLVEEIENILVRRYQPIKINSSNRDLRHQQLYKHWRYDSVAACGFEGAEMCVSCYE